MESTPNTTLRSESAVDFQTESNTPIKFESHLNTKHLFDNFVEGKSNQLARAVGQKLAQAPGEPSANPFFIWRHWFRENSLVTRHWQRHFSR